ncbi:hypothetical protein B0H10DRAFT_1941841 [Mycena sp. CBHHK59/15]|nr:hypothetical protein B0H10DRAFT_1941841 [Mycena sp. CBHHK59/15]
MDENGIQEWWWWCRGRGGIKEDDTENQPQCLTPLAHVDQLCSCQTHATLLYLSTPCFPGPSPTPLHLPVPRAPTARTNLHGDLPAGICSVGVASQTPSLLANGLAQLTPHASRLALHPTTLLCTSSPASWSPTASWWRWNTPSNGQQDDLLSGPVKGPCKFQTAGVAACSLENCKSFWVAGLPQQSGAVGDLHIPPSTCDDSASRDVDIHVLVTVCTTALHTAQHQSTSARRSAPNTSRTSRIFREGESAVFMSSVFLAQYGLSSRASGPAVITSMQFTAESNAAPAFSPQSKPSTVSSIQPAKPS